MRYGFYLPTRGATATPEALETLVTRGEALGFHSVMIADHIVFASEIRSKYPYTVSGAFPGHGEVLEQLTLMAFGHHQDPAPSQQCDDFAVPQSRPDGE